MPHHSHGVVLENVAVVHPVRVLTATDHPVSAAREALWKMVLASLAAEAVNGEQIIVQGASHYIQLDNPDVVVQTILALLPTEMP